MQKNLVIVGSAPLSVDYTPFIDGADIVVRFNDCKNWGRFSGNKTDILFLNNMGAPAQRFIAERPLAGKVGKNTTIWSVRNIPVHHDHFEKVKMHFPDASNGGDDLSEQIIEANQLQREQIKYISREKNISIFNKLEKASSIPFICPSTGILGIEQVLADPELIHYRKHLIGFGFQGWYGHPLGIEKILIARYVLANYLSYYPV